MKYIILIIPLFLWACGTGETNVGVGQTAPGVDRTDDINGEVVSSGVPTCVPGTAIRWGDGWCSCETFRAGRCGI